MSNWGLLRGRLFLLALAFMPVLLLVPILANAESPVSGRGLRVLSSGRQELLLELAVPEVELSQEVTASYSSIVAPELTERLNAPGAPQLPYLSRFIVLPPGTRPVVDILQAETVAHRLATPLRPADGLLAAEGEPAGLQALSSSAWNSGDSLFPAELVRIGEPVYFRDQRLVRVEFFPLQVDPAENRLYHTRELRVRIRFEAVDESAGLTIVNSVSITDLLPDEVLNVAAADQWRSLPAAFSAPEPSLAAGEKVVKLEVDADGMYRVGYADLQAAGMDVSSTNPFSMSLSSQGQPVAIEWFGDADPALEPGEGFYFYGQAFRGTLMEEKYTDVNVYWLDPQGETPAWMSASDATPAGDPVVSSYRASARFEEDLRWNSGRTLELGELDSWYWDYAAINPLAPIVTKTQSIILPHPANSAVPATVQAEFFSECVYYCSVEPHHAQAFLNGNLIDEQGQDGAWVNFDRRLFQGEISQSEIISGANQFDWVLRGDVVGVSSRSVYLNWIQVDYQRQLLAQDDGLEFGGNQAGSWTYQVAGFSGDGVGVWDVTDPLAPVRLDGVVTSGAGPYTATFGLSHAANERFIAAGSSQLLSPLSISTYVPPDLDPVDGADWIAITHPDFLSEAQRLADHRAEQGLRTAVVDVNDLYNQYSDGIFQPRAIHDFLQHAFLWPGDVPYYVVLVGDGNWNFPQSPYYAVEPTYIPPYLGYFDPYQGEVPADNQYVTLVGDDVIPDMALGRLPANSLAQAAEMVDKIIAHDQQLLNPADWQFNVVFLADDPDAGGDFDQQSEEIAGLLPAYLNPVRLYYDSTFTQTSEVVDAFNAGATLFNYRGHGSLEYWASAPTLFDVNAISQLTNADRLPVVLTMDCLDAYFAYPGQQAISEQLLRSANGGSAGHWGSSGLGLSSDHSILNRAFYEHLFDDGLNRLGQLVVASKADFAATGFEQHNLQTFTLLGDPAMPLMVSDLSIDKTSIEDGPFGPGEELDFRLDISNQGLYWGTQAVITDLIPAGMVSTTVSWSGLQITPTEGITYQWSVQPIEPYTQGVITVTGRIDPELGGGAGSTLVNSAEIIDRGLDWDISNNTDSQSVSLGLAELQVAKSAPATAVAGSALTYTLYVTNTGNAATGLALLTDELPQYTSFLWASDAYVVQERVVSWELPSLAPGDSVSRQLRVVVDDDYVGPVSNLVYSVSAEYAQSAAGPEVLTEVLRPWIYLPITLQGG